MARERAGLSQETAAKELGLSGRSKSTLSAWEAGSRDPKSTMLARMARLYGVPIAVFSDPEPTPEERLDEIARLAGERERLDWDAGQGRDRETAGAPDGAPGRSAA